MAGKVEHIGFQLHSDRPVDKEIMEILGNLPQHETKCSYIRKAIMFYYKNKDKEFSSDDKIDEILEILKNMSDSAVSAKDAVGPEPKTEEVVEEKPKKTSKPSSSPAPEKEESKEESDDKEHLKIDADAELDDDSFEDALGDFLG